MHGKRRSIITNLLNLMAAILYPHVQANEVLPPDGYRRLFLFCLTWGFAGLCEPEERDKFCAKMTEVCNIREGCGSFVGANFNRRVSVLISTAILDIFPRDSDPH